MGQAGDPWIRWLALVRGQSHRISQDTVSRQYRLQDLLYIAIGQLGRHIFAQRPLNEAYRVRLCLMRCTRKLSLTDLRLPEIPHTII